MVSRAATSAALEAAARSSTRGRGGAPSGLASSLGAPGQPDLWRRGSRPRALPGWSTLSVLRHWYCQGVLLQVSSGLVLTWGAPHGTVRGTCGTPEAGTRETHAQCCPARGKLPCASSGTHGTREAGIHVPCTCGARLRLQHGCGPLWPHVDTGAAIETRPCLISAWRYHRSLHNTGWRGNAGSACVARERGVSAALSATGEPPRIERQFAPCPDVHAVAGHRGQLQRVPRPDARLDVVAAWVWQTRRLRPRPAGAPGAALSARLCSRLPRAAASLGQSAAWGRAGRPHRPCSPHA